MKLTINVPDATIKFLLRESLELTPEGVKKVMADPRFQRQLQADAQQLYNDADPTDMLHEVVFGNLRLAKKYRKPE